MKSIGQKKISREKCIKCLTVVSFSIRYLKKKTVGDFLKKQCVGSEEIISGSGSDFSDNSGSGSKSNFLKNSVNIFLNIIQKCLELNCCTVFTNF